MVDVSDLPQLAKEKFGDLTEAEEKLFRDIVNGNMADYSAKNPKDNDPKEADGWGDNRVLRASRIAWLCTDKRASKLVTHRGIRIKGARINEEFDLEDAKVQFPLYSALCRFMANINFRNAHMAALYMQGTHTGPLSADGLKTDGPVFFRNGFKAEGEISLIAATVGGNLVCDCGQFLYKNARAINADGLKVGGYIFLRNVKAEGEVSLLRARVERNLECDKSKFINNSKAALAADGLHVQGNVFLRGVRAEGEVRLLGATIGGNLECDNSQFINKNKEGKALSADGLNIGGNVNLRNGFKAEGEVRLPGASVVGDLDCSKGKFINEDRIALFADGLKVCRATFLRCGFKAKGTVSFVGATVEKHFCLGNVDSPEHMTLDLTTANIGTLHDDKIDSWPGPGRLSLHGLEYKNISHESPRASKTRIEWLRLQEGFWPQPYEQLAKVLRESGNDRGAKDVLIAKNKDKTERTKLTRSQWCWYRLLGPRIGYGHRPWLALRWALGFVLVGWFLFAVGYSCGLIAPPGDSAYTTTEKLPVPDPGNESKGISTAYPVFNSLVYSVDVFIPVVDFHQAKYWLPNANRGDKLIKIGPWPLHTGGLLLFWLWTETVLGWVLSTLFVIGFTGLVRT